MGSIIVSRKPAMSLERSKIGQRLLLMTNRKLHSPFRLVPKSTTLVDIERPLRHSVSRNMRLSEPVAEIPMKIDPLSAAVM